MLLSKAEAQCKGLKKKKKNPDHRQIRDTTSVTIHINHKPFVMNLKHFLTKNNTILKFRIKHSSRIWTTTHPGVKKVQVLLSISQVGAVCKRFYLDVEIRQAKRQTDTPMDPVSACAVSHRCIIRTEAPVSLWDSKDLNVARRKKCIYKNTITEKHEISYSC